MQMESSAALERPVSRRKRLDLSRLIASCMALAKAAGKPVLLFLCFFLLPFVRWFGIPSPFAAALMMREERTSPFALLGLAASLLLRLLWGLEWDVWQYVGCLGLWLVKQRYHPKPGVETAALAGLAMMPRAVAALLSGGALQILISLAAIPLAMLAAACLRYAQDGMGAASAPGMGARAAALLLPLPLIAALGYFRAFSLNLGQVAAVVCTLLIARENGYACGAAGGLLCGLSLALGGHDCRVALSLALCGLCCGIPIVSRRRWLCVPAALFGNLLAFFATPLLHPPLSYWAAGLGGVVFALLPGKALDRLHPLAALQPACAMGTGSAFVEQRITHMQDAVERVARALPQSAGLLPSDGEELGALLCAQCANRELCWGRSRDRTERMLGSMMALSQSGQPIEEAALPALAEHGCLRAETLPAMAQEAVVIRQKRRVAQTRARYERELTLTHLAAMSGTLGELRQLATGESYDDLQAAHQLRVALAQLRVPATLRYARRVDGHLQIELETEGVLPIQKPLEALLRYLDAQEGMALSIARAEKGRIELEEIPLYSAAIGTAALCAGQRADGDGKDVCGDACVARRCEGGRLLLMLSDGMGHGEPAHRQSEKTLELLLLLLEAGYTRRQAITAVNGIMLSTQEEGFSTVDLADVDLWTGEVYGEKLGACASWVVRGNHMKKVEGASLPLGIMEEAVPTANRYQLHSGDILVMMSDGVTDVFHSDEHMRRALEESLYIQPQRMADALLRNALLAGDGTPRDDMSVLVMLLMDRQRGGA